jgi:hypothetical protein
MAGTIGLSYAALDESVNGTDMRFGINYLSTNWHYEPHYLNETTDRDFKLFKEQGLEYVTLAAIWKYLEPTLGTYNDLALNDMKIVCNVAADYGLKIIIDFHTMMQNDSFTMPTWLSPRKFETVFTNSTVHAAWLNFLDHCVAFLCDTANIQSWHMMNEPALGEWACNVTVDEFHGLWTEMRSIFKSHSEKPVSIRFGANLFDSHFKRDPRIYEICDYIALNWYEDHCTRERLVDIVTEIQAHNRTVMLSEFGYETNDSNLQTDMFAEYLSLFKSICVNDCIAFFWRADYNSPNPPPPGSGFNLAKNVNGDPRPAFCLMDTVPPNIDIQSPENKTYSANNVSLIFTTNGPTSWVGYSLDEHANVTISVNMTIENLGDGLHTLVLYANDSAGNMGLSAMVYFTVDTAPPVTDSSMSGSLGLQGWYDSEVLVNLIAADATSGVATTSYSFDRATWATYAAPFLLTKEGITTIYYNSTDNVGNLENTRSATVRIDTILPLAPTILCSTHPNQETWYPNHNPIFNWTVASDLSGIAGYSFEIDQVPSTSPHKIIDTTENFRFYTNIPHGSWYFHVRARDSAGNWGPTAHYSARIGCSIRFESGQDNGSTSDYGTVNFGAAEENLPVEVCEPPGTWQVTYAPVTGYIFDHWESTGAISMSNIRGSRTNMTASGDGTLKAVYKVDNPVLFSDGFESGSFRTWTGTSRSSGESTSVVSWPFHHGKFSARFGSDGVGKTDYAYCYKTIPASTELFARGYLYVSRSGIINNSDGFYLISLNAGSNNLAYAGWRKVSGVTKWCLAIKSGSNSLIAYSTVRPSLNRWYCVELHWKKGTTEGLCELWIDGTRVCVVSGLNTATYGNANQVCFGLPKVFCKNTTVYFDCTVISKAYVGLQ